MDSHFNAYKAKFEVLDKYVQGITQSQYIRSMDIFVNLDDVFHNMHRPVVNKEVQLCGIHASLQCASNIINLLAHYKQWAAKKKIKARVFGIYTSSMVGFKNSIYLPAYRDHHKTISDPKNQAYFFVNDAVMNAIPIAQNIVDYVDNVFIINSRYLEPSIIPLWLKNMGIANYDWGMIVSRDHYDLQYAYRDRWIYVSPKGENTRVINRSNMWKYLGEREHVIDIGHNASFYHHNIFPLALAVAGNKLRTIPRLHRIGWKTLFKYLDTVTEKETDSLQIVSSRFLDLLSKKGVTESQIQKNLATVGLDTQVSVMNDIDGALIRDQLKFVSDYEALSTINTMYFDQFPINIPFLTASYDSKSPFFF